MEARARHLRSQRDRIVAQKRSERESRYVKRGGHTSRPFHIRTFHASRPVACSLTGLRSSIKIV
eukprot:39801-Eustigmatos_ZCMA.PRE.1